MGGARSNNCTGFACRLKRVQILFSIAFRMLRKLRSWRDAKALMQHMLRLRKAARGAVALRKYHVNKGRYYLNMYLPGWPSPLFNKFIGNEAFNYSHQSGPHRLRVRLQEL